MGGCCWLFIWRFLKTGNTLMRGFTEVGGWQGRRVSSVIRWHKREMWGPPCPCSQSAWKPVLRVPPAGAQTWAECQEPLRLWFSRRACAPLVMALERRTLAKKIPYATSMEAPTSVETTDIWPNRLPLKGPHCDFVFAQELQFLGPNQSMTSKESDYESPRGETGWEMGRENQGGREGSHERRMYSPTGHVS